MDTKRRCWWKSPRVYIDARDTIEGRGNSNLCIKPIADIRDSPKRFKRPIYSPISDLSSLFKNKLKLQFLASKSQPHHAIDAVISLRAMEEHISMRNRTISIRAAEKLNT